MFANYFVNLAGYSNAEILLLAIVCMVFVGVLIWHCRVTSTKLGWPKASEEMFIWTLATGILSGTVFGIVLGVILLVLSLIVWFAVIFVESRAEIRQNSKL